MSDSPVLFLGAYPPRQSNIANYTASLLPAFDAQLGTSSEIVAVDDARDTKYLYPKQIVARLDQFDRASYAATAQFVNQHPSVVLNIQHEYGLYGGPDGSWLADLVEALRKPFILTLHTVRADPTPTQLSLTQFLCSRSERMVVFSETEAALLIERYSVDPRLVDIIAYGVPDLAFAQTAEMKHSVGFEGRFVLTTFGATESDAGLETAIQAVASVAGRHPDVLYVIAGSAHPNVPMRQRQEYREELRALIRRYDAEMNVVTIDRHLTLPEVVRYLAATDVYVSPFLNVEHVTNETLAYAMGAGKAVLSAPHDYAREVLAMERGVLVPFADAGATLAAFTRIIEHDLARDAMAKRAYAFGHGMTWEKVGQAYLETVDGVLRARQVPVAR